MPTLTGRRKYLKEAKRERETKPKSGGKRAGDYVYHTPKWRKLRRHILRREPLCRMCKIRKAVMVDHIMSIADGGDEWLNDNLQPLCDKCHRRKHARYSVCVHGYPPNTCTKCRAVGIAKVGGSGD